MPLFSEVVSRYRKQISGFSKKRGRRRQLFGSRAAFKLLIFGARDGVAELPIRGKINEKKQLVELGRPERGVSFAAAYDE